DEGQGRARRYVAAVALVLIVAVGVSGMFLSVVGHGLCCAGPQEGGSQIFGLAFFAFLALGPLFFFFCRPIGLRQQSGSEARLCVLCAIVLAIVSHFPLVLFLRRVARFFGKVRLAKSIASYLALFLVSIASATVFFCLAVALRDRTDENMAFVF